MVILQGSSGLTFSPGYTTAAECLQQYKGPNVACFNYDPEGVSWTAFFKLPDGAFRVVRKIPNEGECRRYIDAFRSDVPAACRQLAQPDTCDVACIKPLEPARAGKPVPQTAPAEPDTAPKPVPQALPEHPASIAPTGIETKPSDIQVGGKQYTRVAGLAWVESTKPDSFADVSVGPSELQSKDQPSLLPPKTAEAPKKRVVVAPHYYDRAPQPLQAFIDTVMLPFDFLSYPGRRGW